MLESYDEYLMRLRRQFIAIAIYAGSFVSFIVAGWLYFYENNENWLYPLLVPLFAPVFLHYLRKNKTTFFISIATLSFVLLGLQLLSFYWKMDQGEFAVWFATYPLIYFFILGFPFGLVGGGLLFVSYLVEYSIMVGDVMPAAGLLSHTLLVFCINFFYSALLTFEIKQRQSLLVKMADYDFLTKIYNRRSMTRLLDREISRINRYKLKKDLSLIILDIDHFKDINDKYGHDVGDEILIEFVGILNDWKRKEDLLARWGGEEFVLILRNTDIDEAFSITEKLRLKIENHRFNTVNFLTSSFGVVQYTKEELRDTLISRADSALYYAKQKRNHVISLTPDQEAFPALE